MSTASTQLPEGRYGRSEDERADRKLKVIGSVLGVALLALMGWFAYYYVFSNKISGEVITFKAVSDNAVEVHLEVRKDANAHGYCTLRSQADDGSEVGRADFRFDQDSSRINKVVTIRTTARGGTAELLGCHAG